MLTKVVKSDPWASQNFWEAICVVEIFAGLRPQMSHLGISWDAYDRITNPGGRHLHEDVL